MFILARTLKADRRGDHKGGRMKKTHLILNTAIFITLILLLIVALICGPDLLGV